MFRAKIGVSLGISGCACAKSHAEIRTLFASIRSLNDLLVCANQMLKMVAGSATAGDENPFVTKNSHNRAFLLEDKSTLMVHISKTAKPIV